MNGAHEVPAGQLIDLATQVVGLAREDGRAWLMEPTNGPPRRLDGHTVAASPLTADSMPPHNGEMHPDGDELLYLISGRISVRLELEDGDRSIEMGPGQALVVPQGVWHLISLLEPGQLINVTPGPRGEHRPLGSTG